MRNKKKVALLIESSRSSGRGLQIGIAKYAKIHGPWDFFRSPPFYLWQESLKQSLKHLEKWIPDGIIARDFKDSELLLKSGVPTILTISYKDRIPSKYIGIADSVQIASMAAEHLIERGFKNFGFCGFDKASWSNKRGKAFYEQITSKGFDCCIYHQPSLRKMQLWENERPVLIDWIKNLPFPVGIMACNDERAQDIIDACNLCGVSIPDEVALIGVDNDPLICELKSPQLSSIALNDERAGFEMAELLDSLMNRKEVRKKTIVTIPTHVETRQSSDILAVHDKEVARVLLYIRNHSKELIQVEDVLKSVPLSRRSMERRFKNSIGHTIHDEIQRAKMNEICKLLLETNYSITRIAMTLGYYGVDHFARAFKKMKGITPLAYRKKFGQK